MTWQRNLQSLMWLTAVVCLTMLTSCQCENTNSQALKIGVMLDVGERSYDIRALEWAKENINKEGILGSQSIELVYYNSDSAISVAALAREVGDNEDILGVIGPGKSSELKAVSRAFKKAEKALISPVSTASKFFRVYQGEGFLWRTTQADVAQVESMLLAAVEAEASKVALLTDFSEYGDTFFDFFGFFAAEFGYQTDAVSVSRYEQDDVGADGCEAPIAELLVNEPDILFAVAANRGQLRCMVQTMAAHRADGGGTRLVLSDSGYDVSVLEELGDAAEGVEGFALSAPPDSGFDLAFKRHFNTDTVPAYAANIYDSLLLMAYGLEHSRGDGGPKLIRSIKEVVSYRGQVTNWDASGVMDALEGIRENRRPDVSGATGPLEFDSTLFMDLSESSYVQWRFEGGKPLSISYYSSGESSIRSRSQASVLGGASTAAQQALAVGTYEPDFEKDDLWVIIATFSAGWENYRHEADALRHYQIFRERGVPDDRIIMMIPDTMAADPLNLRPGEVYNTPLVEGGTNLYRDVEIDDAGGFSVQEIKNVLLGIPTDEMPNVLESTESSNVYVYFVGHGGNLGIPVGAEKEEDAFGLTQEQLLESVLTPEGLRDTVCEMQDKGMYRRLLFVVETCFSGVMGLGLEEGCENSVTWVPEVVQVSTSPTDCLDGGRQVDIGPDSDGDGFPDEGPEKQTHTSCNENGAEGLVRVTPVAAGGVCGDVTGTLVELGADLDGNGWLSAEEVTQTLEPVCNTEPKKDINGALMITAANSNENSLSSGYDSDLDVWLSDQFSYKFASSIAEPQSRSLYQLFNEVYLSVSGSHVSMYNAGAFGDVKTVAIDEFLTTQ